MSNAEQTEEFDVSGLREPMEKADTGRHGGFDGDRRPGRFVERDECWMGCKGKEGEVRDAQMVSPSVAYSKPRRRKNGQGRVNGCLC